MTGSNRGGRQLICQHSAHTGHSAETFEIQIMPDFIGERGGTRTLDPMIKSHALPFFAAPPKPGTTALLCAKILCF
jgi:hypothetical protein